MAALLQHQDDAELRNVRKRLAPDAEAFGLRMRDLFEVAKANAKVGLDMVDELLDHPAYEPRLAAHGPALSRALRP